MPQRETLWTVIGSLVALVVSAGAIAYQVLAFDKWKRTVDFVAFYCAANTIRTGSADKLYDVDFQMRCQREVASRTELLPAIHPPFEYLIYLPLTYLPLKLAYVLWTLVSFGGLAASVWLLYPNAPAFGGRSTYLAICVCYYPVFSDLMSGQDSTLLLLVFVIVFLLMKQGRDMTAGCARACGLFKFQWIVPFAATMFLRRKWRIRG